MNPFAIPGRIGGLILVGEVVIVLLSELAMRRYIMGTYKDTSRSSGVKDLYLLLPSLAPSGTEPPTTFVLSTSSTWNAVDGSCFGGDRAIVFHSLMSRRAFCSIVNLGFFAFAGFLLPLVDLALVFGLDFGLALDFAFLAIGFLVAGFLAAAVDFAAGASVVEAFWRRLVVRPV